MLQAFLATIHDQKLFEPEEKILLTVSGGMDSMVMADLFYRSEYPFSIAHCNFQLRGDEADADEELVRSFAKTCGVPFFCQKFETEQFARDSGISIQMAARQLRTDWFESLVETHGFVAYAVAHHLNDSLETFLFNIAKGTGIAGMHGIPAKSGNISRPLIFATHAMIEQYAKRRSLKWREDRSNASVKYHRNRIRHAVIPELKKINPNLEQTFGSTIERINDVEAVFHAYVQNFQRQATKQKGKELWIDIQKLIGGPGAGLVLYEIIKSFHFNYSQARNIIMCLGGKSGLLFYSETHVLNIDRDYIIIGLVGSADQVWEIAVEKGENEVRFGEVWFSLEILPSEEVSFDMNKGVAVLDYNKLQFPIHIRRWQHGDFFKPLGMQGKKKLSDFMIDEKIPVNLKTDVLVLLSGDSIAWVVDCRIDDRFKVTDSTKQVLKITTSSHV